jgi:diacylglycerol kinase family enzyme
MSGARGLIVAIINAAAGSVAGGAAERLAGAFAEAGGEVRVVTAASGEELTRAARAALDAGAGVVAAAGGDGTVGAVASVLAGSGTPLGVLPAGTLNHFAKDLGIPLDLKAAVAAILNGRPTPVDVCEVNGRVFVNNSSLGLYPMIVQQRELQQWLGHRKWPAAAWASVTAMRWYPFLDLRIEAAGETLLRRTPFAFIGNNSYEMQGLRIGSRASLTEGSMCVYILRRTGRLGLARLALSAVAGRLAAQGDFDALCAREVWIDSPRRRLHVALDGEVAAMRAPLRYLIRPGALRVILP